MITSIDINADLGEGARDDALIMPLISSCSVACGGHYGSEYTILQTVKLAMANGVKVGAHPSFPDKVNFGRKKMSLSPSELKSTLSLQLNSFIKVCNGLGVSLNHVKPHGALYNFAAIDEATSKILVASIMETGLEPVLYAPKNSVLSCVAKDYLPVAFEAFVDRRYTDDLQLVSRTLNDAVISSPIQAFEQLMSICAEQKVRTISGKTKDLEAHTFCVHSDNPNALEILNLIYEELTRLQIHIK
ncbi:UPF0271 protein [Patiriisocius marinus]|uniref:UPF0271 protein n=1 Tax=Patiriisocius marinus TaxID=1397112 RepID=A0A5J4J411_9FLAO|nr:LamB/YcsF family protein [Patiriisocius marinus]GER59207.1 UPF0271 protein [Patiriisocius marinus]